MIGIDLVNIPEFKKNLESGGQTFLERTFLPSELNKKDETHLAGVFAAKEAIIKSLGLPIGSWLRIEIDTNTRPKALIDGEQAVEISISHHVDYAVAVATKR